jgi:catechol 2,3-dioxygenase-like lactoylglutathione lyase family enzyme
MDRWKPLSLFHFTLSVSSIERSIGFYTTVGFKLLRDNSDRIWPEYVAHNFGLERAQGRGALLGIGDGPLETRLDLIQWLEPLATFPDPAKLATTVPRIIAIRTENVRAAYEDLCRRGIRFIAPPRPPDAATGIEAVVCCRDPDHTLVELIEYMPGVLGSRIDSLARRPSGASGS